MSKKLGITVKFISIISITTLILLTIIAFTMIITAGNSQTEQAEAFISLLKAEQGQEEKLLRDALLQKGESIATLLANNGAGLIIGYDFDALGQFGRMLSDRNQQHILSTLCAEIRFKRPGGEN